MALFAQEENNIKENLGKSINSQFDELMPILTADGKTLYFCRKNHPMNFGTDGRDDIWYSTLLPTGKWSSPVNIGAPLNNEFSNAVISASADGNTLIVAGEYIIDGKLDKGIYTSTSTIDGWTYPQKVIIKNFHFLGRYISCNLSNDGNTLLMSIDREDSYGGLDLYVSFLMPDGEWSEPVNLGQTVNTELDENTPYLAADGVSLYFSSKGHESKGDYDVFVSRRLDDTWLNWSEPQSLGDNINTTGGDANYIINSSGDYAYFASTENSIGGWDLFRIKLPKAYKPKPVVLISGTVQNKLTKLPVDARIYYQSMPDAKEIGQVRTNPKDGKFAMALPIGFLYRFVIDGKGFMSTVEEIDCSKLDEYKEITKLFELSPSDSLMKALRKFDISYVDKNTEIPEFLDLLPVEIIQSDIFDKVVLHFPYNEFPLNADYFPQLDYITNVMKKYAEFRLVVVGNTDSLGTDAYNLKLSEKRAHAAGDYFIKNGINKKRIMTKGLGRTNPIATNETEEGREKNRRVVFYILKY